MRAARMAVGVNSVLVVALVLLAGVSQAVAAAPLKLDQPPGWRSEDHAYPPPWARELPWRGDLQVRFPPGWFNEDSPNFWSYPVLYVLERDVLSSSDDLARALRAYDGGLYRGQFDPEKIRLEMGEARAVDRQGQAATRRSITFDGFDPFTTRRELKTYLEVFRWYDAESKKTAVLILRSPRPYKEDDPVWEALLPFWEKFSSQGRTD